MNFAQAEVKTATKTPEKARETISQSRKTVMSQSPSSHVDRVLYLQRAIGNQAIQKLIESGFIRAKLKIGQERDIYEQEADRIAKAVTSSQKQQGEIQYFKGKEKALIKNKTVSTTANTFISNNLIRNIGTGQPLEGVTRVFFESRLGHSLSNVRVHKGEEAAEAAHSINALAYTAGQKIIFGEGQYAPETDKGRKLLAHELVHVLQQQGQTQRVQKKNGAKEEPKLLKDFESKFPGAAHLIRKSEAAMKLIKEAADAGAKFGGYAEEGPAKKAWTYTIASTGTVYVPKARADKVLAMSDFLFELNNAVRSPKLRKLEKEAAKGTKATLSAKDYAYKKIELEVEGMLRLGETWFKMKKTIGKGNWNKYDNDFFLSEYKRFKEKKVTKDKLIKEVLQWRNGVDPTKTNEQYYIEQYKSLGGSK
jgi:hypothetical protein